MKKIVVFFILLFSINVAYGQAPSYCNEFNINEHDNSFTFMTVNTDECIGWFLGDSLNVKVYAPNCGNKLVYNQNHFLNFGQVYESSFLPTGLCTGGTSGPLKQYKVVITYNGVVHQKIIFI